MQKNKKIKNEDLRGKWVNKRENERYDKAKLKFLKKFQKKY